MVPLRGCSEGGRVWIICNTEAVRVCNHVGRGASALVFYFQAGFLSSFRPAFFSPFEGSEKSPPEEKDRF